MTTLHSLDWTIARQRGAAITEYPIPIASRSPRGIAASPDDKLWFTDYTGNKIGLSQSVLFHLGGALNERAGGDGAVGNRDAQYVTGFCGDMAAGYPCRTAREVGT